MSSPPTAADVQATLSYRPEIPADSLEIGTYMKAIAGFSAETSIPFMEAPIYWIELATDTPETGIYRQEMTDNPLETSASGRVNSVNLQEINTLRPFFT